MTLGDIGLLFGRALRLRCPVCGGDPMFRNWFSMRERCSRCGHRYEREEGYFTGAMAINLVVTELLILIAVIALLVNGTPLALTITLGVLLPVALPMLGWPFSRSLWVALDLILHPLDE